MRAIQIHPADNVAVALVPLRAGETVLGVTLAEAVAQGHKLALESIEEGAAAVKYGCPIGVATCGIAPGQWVHTHNLSTGLSEEGGYCYRPAEPRPLPMAAPRTFAGFRRPDGGVGVRNELWVIPAVGCVNSVAQKLVEQNQHLVSGTLEGLYTFPHPYGCSQMGADHAQTRRLLAALARHPNAGGVLLLALGCENCTLDQLRAELGEWDGARIKFLTCQDEVDELTAGARLLQELADHCKTFSRSEIPAAQLVVGMKCGGSDGLSGVTANPAVGRFSDLLIAQGGTTVLTEVPEMFGAEGLLFARCASRAVFDRAAAMAEGFKRYFTDHGQVVYENPSPGNKAGGITTLEDKSCGCVQKGGTAPVTGVVEYGQRVTARGLNLLSGPGNDLVSTTALTAAGAHIILFTTGRGTPFGAPVPTVKISSNTALAMKKPGWIDFDAGAAAAGEPLDQVGARLLGHVLAVASGAPTKTEKNGYREIAIFKDGVTL